MRVDWIKCGNNVFCDLLALDLSNAHFNDLEGVYIIWHGGEHPCTVVVGQGPIRERLTAHKQDKEILEFKKLGLYVTWAPLESQFRPGVEKYLFTRLGPKIGGMTNTHMAIEVNLPW